MGTFNSTPSGKRPWSTARPASSSLMRAVQTVSRIVTAVFVAALIWALYQRVANGNPLPLWATLGAIALLAAAIGVGVALLVYRGVRQARGPFDFGQSEHVTGQLQNVTQRVEAGGARALQAEIKMTQGVLQLMGGATDVMEAAFTFDDADWKRPQVQYAVEAGGVGKLAVKQGATQRPAMHQGRSEWLILLNQELPMTLDVRVGAGEADLKLSGLHLSDLRVESGVGKLRLDLSGAWRQSAQAFVKTGIGDAVIRLPGNAGVRVQPAVGLGSLDASDLTWDGEAYTNALYGQTNVMLDVRVEGGMGKLVLEVGR